MISWKNKQPVRPFEKLTVLSFPFYLENLLVIGFFSMMFTIACIWASLPAGMGLRSVSFWFICITLFFNYIFVIVDYTSRGLERVPKLSGEMVFPTHDSRLYTIAILTIGYLAFIMSGWETSGRSIRLIIAFFTYPLMFSLLIVHQRLITLFNPVKLLTTLFLFSRSVDALVFYGWQLLTAVVLYLEIAFFNEIAFAHIFWQVPLTLLLLFITFRSLGVALNTNGPSFGLKVLQNEETHLEAIDEDARIELDKFILKLHRIARVHEYSQAFGMIEEYQKKEGHQQDHALFNRLCQWDDKRLASMLGAQLAERLLTAGAREQALKVFRESYDMAPSRFHFSSGTVTNMFVDATKDLASQERLLGCLQRFEQDFPDHPMTSTIMLKLATLAIEKFDQPAIARAALKTAAAKSDRVRNDQEFKRLLKQISE